MPRQLRYSMSYHVLLAVAFAIGFTGSNSQQTVLVSSLSQPVIANYEYARDEKKFIPVAIVSLTGFNDFGSSFSASHAGWCVGATALGLASFPLQFQQALANYPAVLQDPIWVYRTTTSDGSALRQYRVSSLVSGSTFCFFADKANTFNCRVLQSQNSYVDLPASIQASSFPFSNLSTFSLVDLSATDGGNTFALTAFSDASVPDSLAYTQLLRLEHTGFVSAGGPYTWNDITPTNLPPSQFNSNRQRLALGYNGTIFATGHPSASGGAGRVIIYRIPSASSMIQTSQITGAANSTFGFSVAIAESFLVVGAPGSNSASGSVHVFRLNANGTVSPICSMIDSVASSKFGLSIHIEIDSLRSPFAFHVYVTAPVMVFRPDQSFKYLTVAAIRVNLTSSTCSISGSIQWPTVVNGFVSPDPADSDTLTGVFSSSGQVVSFVKRSGSTANSILQSVFCLPNFKRTSRLSGNMNRNVIFCEPCNNGTFSFGGIPTSCDACPLPHPNSIVVWGYSCEYTCPPGSYRPLTCVFDCDVANSRLNNTEWLPLPAPTCTLVCATGYYNASGTCTACPALVNRSAFIAAGSCASYCLATFFWADGAQVASRINNNPTVMCVSCSEQNLLLGNAPPANGFWQDNATACTFSCNLGYFKSASQCDPCQSKPVQSAWISGSQCQFVCNFGFFGSNCLHCSDFKFASGLLSPANAYWVDGARTCDWACNSGYNNNVDSSRCCPNQPIPNAAFVSGNRASCNFVCNPGFQWSNSTLSCISCPSISMNSTFTKGCESTCKFGFAGNPCISCSDYIGNSVLPRGGVWNMSTCGLSCLSGFRLFSNLPNAYCCPTEIPHNAEIADFPTQCNYKCKEGYRWNSTMLSCSICTGYVQQSLNNTIWGSNCNFECRQNTQVPPNWNYFECLTCPECKNRCLPPSYPAPLDPDVVWTFNSSLSGSSKCEWSCPVSKPQLSGTRCCSRLPNSVAYKYEAAGSCKPACTPGHDALSDPRLQLFILQCVPCSLSYLAPLVPLNGFWNDTAPLSGNGNCQYFCKSGFTMYNSNGTDLCCKLPRYAQLKSNAKECNEWECPSNTYKQNEACYNISVMSSICAKNYYCSQCLSVPGCGWCDSANSCTPGTSEGSLLPSYNCAKWKFGSCADDCVGRVCETCTNFAISDSNTKCSWCGSTSECIRSETASKSCPSNTVHSLEACVTSCSANSDCSTCAGATGCTYCQGKNTCLSNQQHNYLTDDVRRYGYFCEKSFGKSLPGSCPSFADNMYIILIAALGSIACACFFWFLCARTQFIRAICDCCSFRNYDPNRDNFGNVWGDQELGGIHPYNGSGLDPNILQEFPLIKYQQKSGSNIKFQEDGITPSCSVCLGDFEVGDNLRILPCAHSFHQTCIDEWFKVGTDCPLCKADFKAVAQPRAVFRQVIQESISNPSVNQNIGIPGGRSSTSLRRQHQNAFEDDDDDDDDDPPELPEEPPELPRHMVNRAPVPGPVVDAVPTPPARGRRSSRYASSAGADGATANVSIRQLAEVSGGSASQPNRARLPPLQARNSSAAALSPSVSSAVYNSRPLEHIPSRGQRAVPRDRLDQA